MNSPKKVVGVIPARGGSKGIPGKNIAQLGDRPLIAWTIEAAKAALGLERVIVSTDDEEIAAIARQWGAEVPFLRPAELSGDEASATGVMQHALSWLASDGGASYDAIAYLQPTSPFRTGAQLSEALALFARHQPDTLVSVMQVPHNMGPTSLVRPLAGETSLLLESPDGQKFRRQDKERLYARNGPAILIASAIDVLTYKRLYGPKVLGYEMDRISSLDIDDTLDLEVARCLLPMAEARSARIGL